MTILTANSLRPMDPSAATTFATTRDELTNISENIRKLNNYGIGAGTAAYTQVDIDSSVTTAYTIDPNTNGKKQLIAVDTGSAAVTITLPLSSVTNLVKGSSFIIADISGDAATYNITIAINSNTIDGVSSNVTINSAYGYVELVYTATDEFITVNRGNLLARNNTWTGTNTFNKKVTFRASSTSEASQNIPAGDIPTTPTNGDIINNSLNGFAVYEKDLLAHLVKCFFTATSSAGPSNTTSETSILGGSVAGSSTKTLPANWWKPGRTLIIEAHGYLFTDASPVNLTNKTKLAGTTVIDTGAIALPASLSNQGFNVRAIITCRSTGASGNFVGHVIVNYRINSGTTYTASLPVTFTADTTASMAVDCTMQFSAAAANNVCVARQSKMCFEM